MLGQNIEFGFEKYHLDVEPYNSYLHIKFRHSPGPKDASHCNIELYVIVSDLVM